MGEFKARDGQTYRYNPQTGKVEILTTDGYFPVDQMGGDFAKKAPVWTTEGLFERDQIYPAGKDPLNPPAPVEPVGPTPAEQAAEAERQHRIDWENSDPETRTVRYLTEQQQTDYTTADPKGFFTGLMSDYQNPNSQRGEYLLGKFGESMAAFMKAQETTGEDLSFPEFLNTKKLKEINTGYDKQGWRARGEAPPVQNAGRIVW